MNLPGADFWESLAGALACAFFGSVFAAMDAALSSLSPARLSGLLEQSEGLSRHTLDRYMRNPTAQHSQWLVGRVLFMALGAVLVAQALAPFVPSWSVAPLGALAALATYGTFAEIGITLGRRRADAFALRFMPFLRPAELLVVPLAAPMALIGRAAARLVKPEAAPDARLTETEVEWVVAEGQKHGSLGREPAEMIRNVLELKDLVVRDVMVPRTRVSAIEVTRPIADVLVIVASEGHSRFPVYRDKVDNIVGLLYAKDLFRLLKDVRLQERPLTDLVRAPVNFVPETQGVSSVLREMRSRRLHMAVVIDEFGGVSGIVTLEDILEVIVGEIRDEFDTEEAPIQDLGDGRLLVDAAVSVDDLSAYLGAKIPEDGDYESLGGLLLHRAGRVPTVGTRIDAFDFAFIVREADEKRIIKVEIIRPKALSELPPPMLEDTGPTSRRSRRPSAFPTSSGVTPTSQAPAAATEIRSSAKTTATRPPADGAAEGAGTESDESTPEGRRIASARP